LRSAGYCSSVEEFRRRIYLLSFALIPQREEQDRDAFH